MSSKNKISRKKFFKRIASFTLIPITASWYSGTKRSMNVSSPKSISLSDNFNDGINFHDKVIIVKNHSNLKIFSSSCTHLGCKITSEIDGNLVCPCHGSKFNINGVPTNGPAVEKLKELTYTINKKTGNIVIDV